jgi:hypothetical protein
MKNVENYQKNKKVIRRKYNFFSHSPPPYMTVKAL